MQSGWKLDDGLEDAGYRVTSMLDLASYDANRRHPRENVFVGDQIVLDCTIGDYLQLRMDLAFLGGCYDIAASYVQEFATLLLSEDSSAGLCRL
jgi:hypothetical protein